VSTNPSTGADDNARIIDNENLRWIMVVFYLHNIPVVPDRSEMKYFGVGPADSAISTFSVCAMKLEHEPLDYHYAYPWVNDTRSFIDV
jgi:hypothetical protein